MSNLTDIRPKTVKITLDKERSLLYDFNALAALEEEYGDIEKALDALARGSVKAIRAVLWAGLLHEDETLTVKQVGKMLMPADIGRVGDAINEALRYAFPLAEGKNVENPPQ